MLRDLNPAPLPGAWVNLFTPLDKKISVLIPTGTFSLYLQFPEDQIKCISNGV